MVRVPLIAKTTKMHRLLEVASLGFRRQHVPGQLLLLRAELQPGGFLKAAGLVAVGHVPIGSEKTVEGQGKAVKR